MVSDLRIKDQQIRFLFLILRILLILVLLFLHFTLNLTVSGREAQASKTLFVRRIR